MAGQHLEPVEGTDFALAAVAEGTYCRSIPAGRVGGGWGRAGASGSHAGVRAGAKQISRLGAIGVGAGCSDCRACRANNGPALC